MPNLDNSTQQELLALLSPLLDREGERRALLALAFGTDWLALRRIEWAGAVEPFVLRMVAELARFGEIEPGKQALWKLLEAVRERVGTDLQARIDGLESIVNRPSQAPGALTAPSPSAASSGRMHLRVFLASPGDVTQERGLALQVLEQLPYDPLLRGRLTIEAVAWDKPGAGTPMLATMTPQAAIAAGLPKPSECDIVVVLLWSRMGTPLPAEYCKPDGSAYLSGTEWEYLDALDAAKRCGRPEILVYRRTEKCPLYPDDAQFDDKLSQYKNVQTFFAAFRNPDGSIRSGYNQYPAPEAFGRQLDLHLRSVIGRLLQSRPAPATAVPAPVQPAKAPLWQGSPFPGLRAFTPDDAPIYFGRGRETDELVRRLADGCRFLAVVGASGSGKSSLVAAGLIPRLKANAIEGAKDWLLPCVVPAAASGRKQWVGLRFTPGELGDDPFLALATKLEPMLPEAIAPGSLARQLAREPACIVRHAAQALAKAPAWAELMVFMDQFEELLTRVADCHQGPFVELLAAAASAPRVRLVVTMRADFYHRWLDWPRLPEVLRGAPAPVVAPGLAALFEMITGPAARAGLDLQEGLPAKILEDTGSDSGALALLAFALHELYEARTADGRLSRAAYDAFGGVRSAISRRAETTFAGLATGPGSQLHSVFGELVDVDERGIATRRRVPLSRLAATAEATQLIDAFTEARLLVTDRGTAGEPVVEVAHEAVFREWPRLRDWIAERADDLRSVRQAESAAAEWQRSGADASHFWPQERLAPVFEALSRLAMTREGLAEPAKSFLRPEAERLIEELERSETTHYRRAEIGDRLERIGDPRPGLGLRPDEVPDIVWCDVPSGTVRLQDADGEFAVERFFIAKYPVTYRQYKAFLDDPQGYANKKRWWKGLTREKEPGEQYRPTGNCPAENVSWHDAVAYCRWLSERLGYQVRLPTESEWQQAASGGRPEYEYPWGSEWIEACANTNESRLSRTAAVGMYPGGASVQGVFDLSGNVWEWCLNKYDAPNDTTPGGDARRVVRGGSWNNYREDARCASRVDSHPGHRGVGFGFRLVCVSPIR
ncbi:MAG: SUMF1/EgtB/PvdO family nonheme iron enzyme [Candidatus Methylophosphatis roskildensis]